ncbi:riboflavin synthase-like [Vicia villosa]|uniref:riboflavin synthase-like n=1 Tax=Vicia villosa TaxID=3911 RepID=UPI00273B1574|nr:riboflavin synthase-like [Vicia villosa]
MTASSFSVTLTTKIPKITSSTNHKSHNPQITNLRFKPSPICTLLHSTRKPINLRTNAVSVQCLFTSLVEEIGTVKQIGASPDGGFDLKVNAKTILDGINLGDSISVNGTCLTITEFDIEASDFTVGLALETLRKTSLSELETRSPMNLERAVTPVTRMGGHFVQGHVDGTGEIVSMVPKGDSLWVKVRVEKELLKYIVPKGFIAVDGTSLTVVDVFHDEVCFNFMPVAYT